MFIQSNAAQANGVASSSKLVFNRYGDRYFLYQIWVQGEERGSEVPMNQIGEGAFGEQRTAQFSYDTCS